MEPYKNLDGDSGVQEYEIGADFIRVKFKDTVKIYTYTNSSAGADNISEMKRLAVKGEGLNAFINTKVKNLYVR